MLDSRVLVWQKKLNSNKIFLRWWVLCGIYAPAVLFVIGLYMIFVGELPAVIVAMIAFFLARFVVTPVIDKLRKKPHPFQTLQFTPVSSWFFSEVTSKHDSFISDHAVSFASISAVYFYYHPTFGIIALIALLLNGAGRIVLGYHDVWDVLRGWGLGFAITIVTIQFLVPYMILVK